MLRLRAAFRHRELVECVEGHHNGLIYFDGDLLCPECAAGVAYQRIGHPSGRTGPFLSAGEDHPHACLNAYFYLERVMNLD